MSAHTSPRFWLFAATAAIAAVYGRWSEAAVIVALGICDVALGFSLKASPAAQPSRELEQLELRMALPAAVALGVLSAIGLLRADAEATLLSVGALAIACWPGGLSWLARRDLGHAERERGLRFLPACGLGALFTALLGALAGTPPPLLPLQLVWLAVLAHALLVALARVPARARQPATQTAGFAGLHWGRDALWAGLVVAALALLLGRLAWQAERPSWRSVVFTTFVCALLALAATAVRPSWRGGGHRRLFPVAAVALALQLALLYWPPAQDLFGTFPLSLRELALCAAIALAVPLAVGPELRSFHPPPPRRDEP